MRPLLLVLLASVFWFFPSTAFSGELRVTPVKLIFNQQFKNGIITVINEGDEPIQVEIKSAEWTQDAEGKDQYNQIADLIFFPKILKLEKGEQRAVRAGIKSAAVSQEKAYRLFIKELPKATPETQGAQIKFAVQFAVPIFVKPVKEEIKGEITKLTYGNGQLGFSVRNAGNAHFRINSIIIKGSDSNGLETFSQEINGWYLLAGAVRSYGTPVTREICEDTARFAVEVRSDRLMLNEKLDVIKTLCLP